MYSLVLFLLLIIGLYAPSSQGSVFSTKLSYINAGILSVLILLLFFKKLKFYKKPLIIAIGINALLGISTLFTPFSQIKYGNFIWFLNLSLLFCVNIKDLKIKPLNQKVFFLVNIINIVLGFGVIFQNLTVTNFLSNNYNAFYQDLVPNMMFFRKPVMTFATHSIAGFFYFLFFYMNFTKHRYSKKVFPLLFSLCYLVLMFNLKSVTSFLFIGIAIIMIVTFFFKHNRKALFFTVLGFSVASIFFLDQIYIAWLQLHYDLTNIFSSQQNGFLGRFSSSGNLQANFNYLADNYFRPVGFGYSPDVYFVDSGIIEYTMRGTPLLTIFIYIGLFIFLKNNLRIKKTAIFIFIVFMVFEVGFSGLIYFRTVFFLPFLVVYLNNIQSPSDKEGLFNLENFNTLLSSKPQHLFHTVYPVG